jgi:hypothetical protein
VLRNSWWAKLLRLVGIVFMTLTAVFTFMGGAGTSCVTLNPTGYGGKFSGIASFQCLYVLFVLIGIAVGIMGIRAVVLLIKGAKNAYRYSVIALILGTVLNAIHVIVSRTLRGGSMPVDMVLYMNIATLILFVIYGLPGFRQAVNYAKALPDEKTDKVATSIVLGATGLLTLLIQFVMAPTHTIAGINYADVWHVSLSLVGSALILFAISFLILNRSSFPRYSFQISNI